MTKKAVVSQLRQHEKYERLIAAAKRLTALATAVAHPCDESSLRGALEAAQAGLIIPILVGPKEKIRSLAKSLCLDIEGIDIVDVPHSHAAADKAVELVRVGEAELLMKGSLHSDELLGAVTKRDTGLRTGRRISHVFVMDVPTHPQTLFITDAAVNIAPDLMAKRDIIQNAIDLYGGLGLGTPKVAILSAVETVNPEHSIDDRGSRAVQDGRPWPDHGRRARWSARIRQRDQPRGGTHQGHQSRRSRARLRSWSCPTSKPAICWPRT